MEELQRKNIRMKESAWHLLHEAASKNDENPAVILEKLIYNNIDERGVLINDKESSNRVD